MARKKQRVTLSRMLTVRATYTLDVENPKVAAHMLKKAEERGAPYPIAKAKILKRGRFSIDSVEDVPPSEQS